MKAWQHGYDLSILKAVEERFADYNKVVLSPFAQMKKNRIADLVHNKKMDTYAEPPQQGRLDEGSLVCHIPTNIAQHAVHVKAYGSVDLGIRQKGERMIDNPVGEKSLIIKQICSYKENLWMTINSEYKLGNDIANDLGFEKIGIKVNSFSDIINVYVKKQTEVPMKVFLISPMEAMNITKLGNISKKDLEFLQLQTNKIIDMFANHYSNYNKKKSWSAVSLRGYSADPTMIEKPSEMNDKWKKEHSNEKFVIQDTPLMRKFSPTIDHILKMIPAKKERVRLMRLEPNGGTLDRHTDQTDKYLGIEDGDITRLHIPIFTNNDVTFSSWNWNGEEDIRYMGEGELWYLDIRKPHKAVNCGKVPRTHLVIDVVANNNIRGMIENGR